MMTRIKGVNPDDVDPSIKKVFDAQSERWGAPLLNHLVYARRPTIFRGVRAMWTGISGSGLLNEGFQALLNRRAAALNGCAF